jgi:hypothetical protein
VRRTGFLAEEVEADLMEQAVITRLLPANETSLVTFYMFPHRLGCAPVTHKSDCLSTICGDVSSCEMHGTGAAWAENMQRDVQDVTFVRLRHASRGQFSTSK